MNPLDVEPSDQSATNTVFRRVMVAVTEQACAEGRQGEVMEALFPVFLHGVGDHDGEDLDP
jgi:hypothetical protein